MMLTDQVFAIAQIADQTVLVILLLMSVFSIGVILERYVALRKLTARTQLMRAQLKVALAEHDLNVVEKWAADTSTIEGRVLSQAVQHVARHGEKGLDEIFNSFILTEKPELEKSLGFLATVGSNAPYIGLLGTVLGIMKAFQDLAKSTEAGQQTVMAGISLALVATAAGLFVAIPAVIAFNVYQKKVKAVLQNLEALRELSLAYAKAKGKAM